MGWGALIAGGLGAAGSIASGVIGSNAAGSAAQTEANAAGQATQAELQMFGTTQNNLAPFLGAGTDALGALQKILGIGPGGSGQPTNPILQALGYGPNGATGQINPSLFEGSPGYQYALQQGTKAVTNAAGPGGGVGGNALKALQTTGQGLANQNFSQYLAQLMSGYSSLTGNLSNVANNGQNAAANLGSIGTTVGGQVGGNAIGAGNALGAGQIGSANALSGGIGGVGQSALLYALMNQSGPNGLSNLLSGATGSAASQYANPYGATGFGQVIVGDNGLMGGGV